MLHFSYRIEQAMRKSVMQSAVSATERNSLIHQGLINAINIHIKAIEFVILIINLLKKFLLRYVVSFIVKSSIFRWLDIGIKYRKFHTWNHVNMRDCQRLFICLSHANIVIQGLPKCQKRILHWRISSRCRYLCCRKALIFTA